MEVSTRKKRVAPAASTGLGTHTNSIVSEYGSQVRMAASAAATNGLSSGSTRRSYGASSAAQKESPLSMYNEPPQEEITLDQFERAGVDRLQALKQMENLRLKRGAPSKNAISGEVDTPISQILAKYSLENRPWDNLSHFVLRLAYSKTEELRRWLITQESALFKYRFDTENEETISAFLHSNDMKYEPLTADELNTVIPHEGVSEEEAARMPTVFLRDLLHRVPYADIHQSIYYKVPFEDAIDLLRERKVYLHLGHAYVSRSNLSAIITTKFRANLSLHLGQTCRATSQIKQDPRIVPLVNMLGKQYITPLYKAGKIEGAVTKEQIPLLAERSMPLCMSTLYSALKGENHLKHGGRMQFGLFLKGIGLSLADALAFWKSSFARRTPPEKFDKEYAYNIRHNYGKEGKRTTYTPYGCIKIIQSAPAPGDHHGCPFRQFDESTLRVKMKGKSFTPPQMDEIMALIKGSHYQIACQRFYQFSHGGVMAENVGNHPNVYFDASENYWREQTGAQPLTGPGSVTAAAQAAAAAAAGAGAGAAAASASSSSSGVYNAMAGGSAAAQPAAAAAAAAAPSSAASAAAPAASSSAAAPMDLVRADSPAPMES